MQVGQAAAAILNPSSFALDGNGPIVPDWVEDDAGTRLSPPDRRGLTQAARPQLAGVGQVWEWTSSVFRPYPGFEAFPYEEYSQVFFGDAYRVLRGHSWATHPRVARPSFRNWDLPQRRQIFAGIRLAADA